MEIAGQFCGVSFLFLPLHGSRQPLGNKLLKRERQREKRGHIYYGVKGGKYKITNLKNNFA